MKKLQQYRVFLTNNQSQTVWAFNEHDAGKRVVRMRRNRVHVDRVETYELFRVYHR